jgi:hypothetical protein
MAVPFVVLYDGAPASTGSGYFTTMRPSPDHAPVR